MDMNVLKAALPEILTQLFGFLIVFWILKTYAFGAILQTIDARRAKIDKDFRAIEESQKAVAALEADYQKRLQKIEDEARVKIQEASKAGVELGKDIQQKARQEAEKLIARAQSEIEQDIARAKIQLRDQIVELSALMTEKVIQEKVDAAGHRKLVERFMEEAVRS